ncbi:MAG TPA: hypothetical protein VGG33_28295, partial [Polyangia bacterium]
GRGLSGSGRSSAVRGAGSARGSVDAVSAPPTRVDPPQVVRPDLDLRPPVILRRPVMPPPEPEAPEPTLAPIPDAEDPRDDDAARERPAEVVRARRSLPRPAGEPLRWSLSASGLSGWGPLPKQAFGAGIGLDVGSENFLFNVRAFGSPTVETPQDPGMRLRFASAGGSVSGCGRGHLGDGPLAVAGCVGVQVSVLRGEALGTTTRETALAPLGAGLASLRFEIPIAGAISLQLGGDLAVSLRRPRFEIGGLGDVFQVPRVAPVASIGLAARL